MELRFGGVIHDDQAAARMTRIANRLAASTPELAIEWRLYLLRSVEINGFSLPGGLIYATQGLYQRIGGRDDLLAAVIAHEIAHVVSRDSLRTGKLSSHDSLKREMIADRNAAAYLHAAGYPPQAMPELVHLIRDRQTEAWLTASPANLATPPLMNQHQ